MKRIVISVINDLVTDQRVHKLAHLLYEEGNEVLLIGRVLPESLPVKRDYRVLRMKLFFSKGPLFYFTFNIRLFFILLFHKADILVANDLDTLPANFLAALIRHKPLVYDTHEIFTEMPELQNRPLVRKIWLTIEKFIFPKLKYVYTVNQSIAGIYHEKYNVEVHVVRNIPPNIINDKWPTRGDLSLPTDKNIVILQGAGININRGAEEAILAMKYIENIQLLIIGSGEVLEQLKKMVLTEGLSEKVTFLPKMPYEQLISYTRLADIGLSLDKDTNLNYKYSLPNKLFDYIQAEIPVLCSDLTEVSNIVRTWEIGTIAENHDPGYLAIKINEMIEDRERYNVWKQNLKKAASELNWDKEKHTLLKIYNNLIR
jgi:glycosyltransferase involved in cell wall biosynthesis